MENQEQEHPEYTIFQDEADRIGHQVASQYTQRHDTLEEMIATLQKTYEQVNYSPQRLVDYFQNDVCCIPKQRSRGRAHNSSN